MRANNARKHKVDDDVALANGVAWAHANYTAHRANALSGLQEKTAENTFERGLLDLLVALEQQALEKAGVTQVPDGCAEGKGFFDAMMRSALREPDQLAPPAIRANKSRRAQVKRHARNTAVGVFLGFLLGLAFGLCLFFSR